ncbi:hypothetical protein [Spartinivicinus ruber]|uniref:hypothetical protein n=1 Tax=Spartinivicinus ruber TaxID=2683272 RepID=UPI0013D137BF|nr:hypothetical protein [Spartinivicinus ruber]
MNHFYIYVISCLVNFLAATELNAIELVNGRFKVDFNPETMALVWQTSSGEFAASAAKTKKITTNLEQVSASSVRWLWSKLGVQGKATLNNNDLFISFEKIRESEKTKHLSKHKTNQSHFIPQQTLTWFSLPAKTTNELLLPLAEGFRVPVKHQGWQQYLAKEFDQIDTTWDLKLPFWSQTTSQGKTVSWILLNPYNNKLHFQQANGQLKMTASHTFNQLNSVEQFSVLVHLGNDLLSGARRYRLYLQQQNQLPLLSEKLAKLNDGEKIIGATHIYLFGEHLLSRQDVKNWRGLIEYLTSLKSKWLSQYFSKEQKQVLKEINPNAQWVSQYHQRSVIDMLKQALTKVVPVSSNPNKRNFIDQQYQAAQERKKLAKEKLIAFLKPAVNWGQGLSSA